MSHKSEGMIMKTILLLLTICAVAAAAHASPVYTETLLCNGPCFPWDFGSPGEPLPASFTMTGGPFFTSQGIIPGFQITAMESFTAQLLDFTESLDCSPYVGITICRWSDAGDFSGGTVSFDAGRLQFLGRILSGNFGQQGYDPFFPGGGSCCLEIVTLDFDGWWSNGWHSTGQEYIAVQEGDVNDAYV